jgi:hypothetical protein
MEEYPVLAIDAFQESKKIPRKGQEIRAFQINQTGGY